MVNVAFEVNSKSLKTDSGIGAKEEKVNPESQTIQLVQDYDYANPTDPDAYNVSRLSLLLISRIGLILFIFMLLLERRLVFQPNEIGDEVHYDRVSFLLL
jgi:hypothetical protein